MSIANEITRIKNAKTDIATSIAKKGVTVPEETKIDGYSALIDGIETIPEGYADVTGVNTTTKDVLWGKKFVANDGSVTLGTMPNKGAVDLSVVPLISKITIPEGYHNGKGTVQAQTEELTVQADKEDYTVYEAGTKFWTKVTVEPATGGGGADVSGVTATPEDVLTGKKFVTSDGELVLGAMPKHVKITKTLSTNGETYPIPKGYHDGEGVVICKVEEIGGINPEWTNWTYLSNGNNRNDLISKLKYDDTRNGTTFNNMCNGCTTLEEVPAINTEKGKSFLAMFTGCTGLKRVLEINVSNAASNNMMQKIFENCSSLEEVYFKGIFPVKGNLDVFSWCPLLDEENKQVLSKFLAALSNTGTITRTITIGSTNLAKLTADQIKIATDKNITLA